MPFFYQNFSGFESALALDTLGQFDRAGLAIGGHFLHSRALAKQLHPDLVDGGGPESKEAFLRVQEAYDVLRDPQRRAHYDYELAREAAKAAAARESMRQPLQVRPAPKPPVPTAQPAAPGQPPRMLGLRRYVAAIGLVVMVTGGIVTWQLFFKPKPQPIIIVKVDPNERPRSARGTLKSSHRSRPGSQIVRLVTALGFLTRP